MQTTRIGQVGEGSGRGTTNQGETRHRDVMETCRNLSWGKEGEAARETDSEGWRERESEAFSRRSGFEEPQ